MTHLLFPIFNPMFLHWVERIIFCLAVSLHNIQKWNVNIWRQRSYLHTPLYLKIINTVQCNDYLYIYNYNTKIMPVPPHTLRTICVFSQHDNITSWVIYLAACNLTLQCGVCHMTRMFTQFITKYVSPSKLVIESC